MKLTACLFKQNLGWWFKKLWKVKGQLKVAPVAAPERLKARGVLAVDAVAYTRPPSSSPPCQFVTPEQLLATESIPISDQESHERPCHFYTADSYVLEGKEQIQNLTKTICRSGLPFEVGDVRDSLKIPSSDLDDLYRNSILSACVFDAYQEKLEKTIDKERPYFNFKRQYGIPKERKTMLLTNAMLRLASMVSSECRNGLERSITRDAVAAVWMDKGGDLLQYHVKVPLLVSSHQPMGNFGSDEDVVKSKEIAVPNIYPIKCTIDLKQDHQYQLQNFFSLPKSCLHRYAHTIFLHNMANPEGWTRSQMIGRALGVTYAFAVAQARQLFDLNEGVAALPQPINLQCIQTDGCIFDFICFQLNTLDLNNLEGIKNLAWIDSDHKIYDRCEKINGRIEFEGCNWEVFNRISAFYRNGLQ